MSVVLFMLVACGGGAPAPEVAPVAAPTSPTPEASLAAVGPDGPSAIVIPIIPTIPTDATAISAGEKVFTEKGCAGCHKFGEKLVGPDFNGLFTRRTVPWVTRMVISPDRMTKEDPAARDLFRTLMVQMPNQNVPEGDIPNLLAYIKSKGG